MGYAIAQEAAAMGATVTLITGPTSLTPPAGVETVHIETTEELYRAVSSRFARCDCLIMAAAPADYAPNTVAGEKIKKNTGHLQLDLKPTRDILKEMGQKKKKQVLVGFALETQDGVDNARKKLKDKNLDLIVLNNPREKGAAFDHDTNRVTIIRAGKKVDEWPLMEKTMVAAKLLALVRTLL